MDTIVQACAYSLSKREEEPAEDVGIIQFWESITRFTASYMYMYVLTRPNAGYHGPQ